MTEFEKYLEDARIRSEAEENAKTEAAIEMLERERVARNRQRIEDPLLMWNEVARQKSDTSLGVESARAIPGAKRLNASKLMDEAWWRGYGTGTIITALLALSALFVWWQL